MNLYEKPVKTKKQAKADSARLNRLYGQYCNCIQVPIMALPKIFEVGMVSLDLGGSDEVIGEVLKSATYAMGGKLNP